MILEDGKVFVSHNMILLKCMFLHFAHYHQSIVGTSLCSVFVDCPRLMFALLQ